MRTVLYEWGALLLRPIPIVEGIAWIGSSFYLTQPDAAIRPTDEIPKNKGGEAWEASSGGFPQARKYLVAPARLPEELIWRKWQAYVTRLGGFALRARNDARLAGDMFFNIMPNPRRAVERNKSRIGLFAAAINAMAPRSITETTNDERRLIVKWASLP
jgi:uncharacterized membrane protein